MSPTLSYYSNKVNFREPSATVEHCVTVKNYGHLGHLNEAWAHLEHGDKLMVDKVVQMLRWDTKRRSLVSSERITERSNPYWAQVSHQAVGRDWAETQIRNYRLWTRLVSFRYPSYQSVPIESWVENVIKPELSLKYIAWKLVGEKMVNHFPFCGHSLSQKLSVKKSKSKSEFRFIIYTDIQVKRTKVDSDNEWEEKKLD